MAKFNIGMYKEMYASVVIEADTLENAISIAQISNIPAQWGYVSDSFKAVAETQDEELFLENQIVAIIEKAKNGTTVTVDERLQVRKYVSETIIQSGTGQMQIMEDIQLLFPYEYDMGGKVN